MTTTNFEEWLDHVGDYDIESLYLLYMSISHISSMGQFQSSKRNGRVFVQRDSNNLTLILSSEKAVKAFLKKLDNDFSGDFGDIYGAYEFERSMSKNE